MQRSTRSARIKGVWQTCLESMDRLIASPKGERPKQEPAGSLWSYLQMGTGVVAAVMLVGSFAMPHVRRAIATHLPVDADCIATGDFSPESFRMLKAGMSGGVVRNLVGIPLIREQAADRRSFWVYSLAARPNRPYVRYSALFDANGYLLGTRELRVKHGGYMDVPWMKRLRMKAQGVRLIDKAGKGHAVTEYGDASLVVAGGPRDSVEAVMGEYRERLDAMGLAEVPVLYLAQPGQSLTAGGAKGKVFTSSQPPLSDLYERIVYVVDEGDVCALPPHSPSGMDEDFRRDETWAFRRLLHDLTEAQMGEEH